MMQPIRQSDHHATLSDTLGSIDGFKQYISVRDSSGALFLGLACLLLLLALLRAQHQNRMTHERYLDALRQLKGSRS